MPLALCIYASLPIIPSSPTTVQDKCPQSLLSYISSIVGVREEKRWERDKSFIRPSTIGIHYPHPFLFLMLAIAALLVDAIGILISRKNSVAPPERISTAS